MTASYGGRTFDRIERVDPRSFDYLVVTSPAVYYDLGLGAKTPYISAEDRIILSKIDALTARVTALEAAVPVPPAPAPPPPAPQAQSTVWACGQVLDQGRFGMCVGYAWSGLAMSSPHPETIVVGTGDQEGSTPDEIYDQAQVNDGSTPDPQTGASTTGGAQASKQMGFIKSYSWALNIGQITSGIQHVGPCVVGMPWRSTMMNPDGHGVLDVGDKSKDVGGHEFFLPGYFPAGSVGNPSATEDMVGIRNSWGPSWGRTGNAFIPVAGLADMLADGGDATFPSKV